MVVVVVSMHNSMKSTDYTARSLNVISKNTLPAWIWSDKWFISFIVLRTVRISRTTLADHLRASLFSIKSAPCSELSCVTWTCSLSVHSNDTAGSPNGQFGWHLPEHCEVWGLSGMSQSCLEGGSSDAAFCCQYCSSLFKLIMLYWLRLSHLQLRRF